MARIWHRQAGGLCGHRQAEGHCGSPFFRRPPVGQIQAVPSRGASRMAYQPLRPASVRFLGVRLPIVRLPILRLLVVQLLIA
jgi:hypothetical protein